MFLIEHSYSSTMRVSREWRKLEATRPNGSQPAVVEEEVDDHVESSSQVAQPDTADSSVKPDCEDGDAESEGEEEGWISKAEDSGVDENTRKSRSKSKRKSKPSSKGKGKEKIKDGVRRKEIWRRRSQEWRETIQK
jgi:hypothetical protein